MTIQVIKSPSNEPVKNPSIFLAGGLFNCPDWQATATELFARSGKDLTIINPRRDNFTPDMHREQVLWETEKLEQADLVLFWFPHETLCPMTLYEFGWLVNSDKDIVVGASNEYKRLYDIQLRLIRLKNQVVNCTLSTTVHEAIFKLIGV